VAVEIKLPRLGQGMESGTIVRWLKGEGDEVAKGDPLYELDTDKVTQEVEADAAGTLLKIVVTAGEVGVGATVAVVGAPGEDVSVLLAASPGGNGGASAAAPASSAETPPAPGDSGPPGEPAVASEAPALRADSGGRVKASPLARRIARERGLDLAVIAGTGPDGRVIAVDVEQASGTRAAGLAAGEAGWAGGAGGAGGAGWAGGAGGALQGPTVVELTSTRRTIARRLTEAWQAPVFQLVVTADATQLVATRERLVELMREGDVKPTVSDVLTRLVASALVRHPAVNAHLVDGRILRFPQANVGLAVAAPSGLVVPVVRGAGHLSVQEIATVRADLVSRAREGKLQLADLEDGTFTISNLGMYAIEQFVAVLNPPQVAILAVGSIEDRPTARDGALVVAPTMTMTLTCDHRAIDGSEGAEFLRDLEAFVEQPALAL
jgi:pyruvate dehydrogenase E2 component (dihydrolipoamide acetyltransferase)